jgi:ATP synthase subunit H
MSFPTALLTGTIAYLIIGAIIHAMIVSSRASGMVSKDNAGIAQVVVSIGVFSTWLFWLSAWMHQWHPLIKPIYEG